MSNYLKGQFVIKRKMPTQFSPFSNIHNQITRNYQTVTKMKQGLLSWSPTACPLFLSLSIPSPYKILTNPAEKPTRPLTPVHSTLNPANDTSTLFTARERRQLRNERRDNKPSYNWREEVEEKLIKKPKKRYKSWTEELSVDNLAMLGPQWWVVRVARVSGLDTAERLANSLAKKFGDWEFEMYAPAIQVKRKLKNGSISVKPKSLFPGCIFLRCVINKEIHDFIRDYEGVRGFIGSKVGNTFFHELGKIRDFNFLTETPSKVEYLLQRVSLGTLPKYTKWQINKPRPVDTEDMEAIFKQTKKEQEQADRAFEEEQRAELSPGSEKLNMNSHLTYRDDADSSVSLKPKKRSKKASELTNLIPGSTVQVVSGAFTGFSGILKKLDRKTRLATVGFTLFGKGTLADLDVNEIVADMS